MLSDRPIRLPGRQLLLILLAPLLLWPAAINGGPFFFPDTAAYIRAIDALALRTTGISSEWTSDRTVAAAGRQPGSVSRPAPRSPLHAKPVRSPATAPVLSGRSPFYGALLYVGVLLGSLWWSIAAQAIIAAAAIIGVMRHAIDPAETRRFAFATIAAFMLLALTPLPYFASMLMPDMFAGLAIVAAAVLLAGWRRETVLGRAGWIGLAAYAALVHSSVLLVLGGLVAGATLLALARRAFASQRSRLVALAAAAAAGLVGDVAFSSMVTRLTGNAPVRPPFITARLTADGVGADYLRRECATSAWTICRFRSRLPVHSDSFLWSPDPQRGVFLVASPSEQRALSAEQGAFALAVLRSDPAAMIRSSARAFVEQLGDVGMTEFHYPAPQRAEFAEKLPPGVLSSMRETAAFRQTMPIAGVAALTWPLTIASLLVVFTAALRPQRHHLAAFGFVVIAGWLLNDAVCGALSTPHARYQTRVIWALPLIASMIAAAWWNRRRAPPAA